MENEFANSISGKRKIILVLKMKLGSVINHIFGILFYLVFLVYFGSSIASLIIRFDEIKTVGLVLNLIVLFAELIGPIYATYFTVQLIDGLIGIRRVNYDINKVTNHPKVDVIVPIHNVNPKMLNETLQGCSKMDYPNYEVWIGDDHSNPKYADSCKKLAEKYGANYYFGEERSFKAGVVNRVLEQSDAKYVFLLDADHIPVNGILDDFVAILEQHPEYAFVQAQYKYRNITNLLNVWDIMSSCQIFCAQGGKMFSKSVLFYGTSACFRKERLYPLPEDKLSEDFDHTMTLAAQGYHGYWLNKVASSGLIVESFEHKMSQQFRWSIGQIGAVKDHFKDFFKSRMKPRQGLDYFMVSTFVFLLTAFYFIAIFYIVIYFLDIPVPRAFGLDHLSFIIMPLVIGIVYTGTFFSVAIYCHKNDIFKFKIWHVPFFMLFGGLIAPFLIIPSIMGLNGSNKIKGKKTVWNRKVRLVLIGTIYSIIGLVFAGLTVITFLDMINVVPWIDFYSETQYFFQIFLSVAFMLGCALPFVLISKRIFRKPEYYLDEENIYY
ncbi:MAG: glycosyltransferase [Asgard group archaeon]|nr:glycosyltransferase [Asgard group archaeon]